MKTFHKYLLGLLIVAFGFSIALLGSGSANANPGYLAIGTSTAAATGTRTSLTPGASASTTLTYDSYGFVPFQTVDTATLLIQSTASSTASTLAIRFFYSMDSADWYEDNLNLTQIISASSSNVIPLQQPSVFNWTPATTTRTGKAINFKIPTRYVRVQIETTAGTSSVWATIVPIKEATNR